MRKILALIGIVLFVWSSLLIGLGFISKFVLPLSIPVGGWLGRVLTGTVRVGISALLAILWLWVWKKIEYAYFWRTLRRE